jgi:hypothetical protein
MFKHVAESQFGKGKVVVPSKPPYRQYKADMFD